MRYFRYRATITNCEGRSNKSKTSDKNRISKSKPGKSSTKSDAGSVHGGDYIKSEYPPFPLSHYSPASTASPYLSDNRDDFGARFLTPCSDDMSHRLSVNPAAIEGMPGFGGAGGAAFSPALDFMSHGPDNMHGSDFSLFDEAAFDMSRHNMDAQTATTQLFDDNSVEWNDRLQNQI